MQEFLNTLLGTFHDPETFLRTYGYFAILLLTFLEGETIVILAGITAAQGLMDPFLVGLSGFSGSFLGDQLYYAIGRCYGQPILDRRPSLRPKIEWTFRLVQKYQDLYILSFRFVYGVRNVSPFVIAISGVGWLRFMILNAIAALLWAILFTSGGYFFGHAMERFLGEYQSTVLLGVMGGAIAIGATVMVHRRMRQQQQGKDHS